MLAILPPGLTGAETSGLWLSRTDNFLVIHGDFPGREIRINYLEAYCRAGSTDADWRTHTKIPHRTELVSLSADRKVMRLRDEVAGVTVDHTIVARADEVEFRLHARNGTDQTSEVHWAQPCVRLAGFTGYDRDTGGNRDDYLPKCFIFLDGRLTRLPTPQWATQARYTPGQVWCPAHVPRTDVNPRPLSPLVPSNGLIGCFSADEKLLFATAWEPYQELFQGIARCLHSDFRLGGLPPRGELQIRGRIYVVPNDVPALLRRYAADFPEHRRPAPRPPRGPAGGCLYYEGYTYRDNTEAVANPHILGPLFQLYWSEIERRPGEFDWRDWDRRLAPWLAAGKKYALRIMWCSSGNWPHPAARTPTPAWVWAAGAKFARYEANGTEIPLFWDPIYRRHARRFMAEVARKFEADERLLFIDVTPGAETNPYRFRVFNAWRPQFREEFAAVPASDGRTYDDTLWFETVKAHLDDAAAVFRQVPLLATLNVAGMSAGDRLVEVGAYAVERGYYVGQNGLSPANPKPGTRRAGAFAAWSKQTRIFFEMVDATGKTLNLLMKEWGKPPVPGAKDEPERRTLLDYVQSAEALRCHYLNVYAEDVIKGTRGTKTYDPAWEDALRRAATSLGQP